MDDESWDVLHIGTADAPDHGAQAVMRTSDGDFRISAAEVDGKVGLKIERLHPDESEDSADGAADDDDDSDDDGEDVSVDEGQSD